MKLLSFLLMIALHASARTYSQEISISLTDAHLETVFRQIRKQTHYKFIYTREQLRHSRPVTVNVKQAPVTVVLDICFRDQPLTYVLEENVVIIRIKEKPAEPANIAAPVKEINGRITNEQGEPLAGVTIALKGTNKAVASNEKGEFRLDTDDVDATLVITSIGYQRQEVKLQGRSNLLIVMKAELSNLDETVVIAYGSTTRRFNTGSVSKLTAEEISKQPVSNPLATLQGRIPGLVVTQSNGLPGSGFNVLIRGRNSIQNGNAPLFVIDGIPFLSPDERLTQRSAFNANHPFNTLNPEDIASIEVLKDADATAIFGSRGANGVVLITTKRAKSGSTRFDVSVYNGWAEQTRTLNYLNTSQYLMMRREAFSNDSTLPSISNAPDLLLWDTTRSINWRKVLMGKTAHTLNANLRYNGGNEVTVFTFGANYNEESTVFRGDFGNREINASLSVSHKPVKKRFSAELTSSYSSQRSRLPLQNIGQYLNLPPHAMDIYDSLGRLNWTEGGEYFGNPVAYFLQSFTGITRRFSSSTVLRYKLLESLNLSVNGGYNSIWFDETSLTPISSQNPTSNPLGSASFGNTSIQNWAFEPQLEYFQKLGKMGKLQLLTGLSWQESETKKTLISGSGYTNDALIESTIGAATVTTTNSKNQYRYQAIFSRLSYNWGNKYFINTTARRDGSSRFGPDRRYAKFAAIGIGWIFSSEKFMAWFKQLSHGKIRASFGTAGNDQINNYQYLDTWTGTRYPYLGVPGYRPSRLFNPDYSWEQIRKTEAAIELGFWSNKILITAAWFKARSDNQIINYNLPSQTGFGQILRNFPGVVENTGYEIETQASIIKSKNVKWTTSLNITFPKNRLVSFPGLENSTYANSYVLGKSLNSYLGYHYLGIDSKTGLYSFLDVNKNGQIDFDAGDFVYNGTTDPVFYGGIQNSIGIRNFEIDFLVEFRKQQGLDVIKNSSLLVGSLINMPKQVLDRWQTEESKAEYQRFSQDFSRDTYLKRYFLSVSNARLTDASFIRLRNINVSYYFEFKKPQKSGIRGCKIYTQAQNLLTFTNYAGADPENQSLVGLSPMRVIALGTRITF